MSTTGAGVRLAKASRAAQGLPPRITDTETLRRIATVVTREPPAISAPLIDMSRPAKPKGLRPGRRMPPLTACELHWNVPPSICIRCVRLARCERAHVIDRSLDGLDAVQNLVPLCARCHKVMPSFAPGEESLALAWLRPYITQEPQP